MMKPDKFDAMKMEWAKIHSEHVNNILMHCLKGDKQARYLLFNGFENLKENYYVRGMPEYLLNIDGRPSKLIETGNKGLEKLKYICMYYAHQIIIS